MKMAARFAALAESDDRTVAGSASFGREIFEEVAGGGTAALQSFGLTRFVLFRRFPLLPHGSLRTFRCARIAASAGSEFQPPAEEDSMKCERRNLQRRLLAQAPELAPRRARVARCDRRNSAHDIGVMPKPSGSHRA